MGKVAGKDLVFKLGTGASFLATVGIFDPSIDEGASEIDVTDSSSTAKEYLAGYPDRSISWSKWYSDADTPEAVGDTVYFSWKAGSKTFSGAIVVTGRKVGGSRDDAHRYDYSGRISGALAFA